MKPVAYVEKGLETVAQTPQSALGSLAPWTPSRELALIVLGSQCQGPGSPAEHSIAEALEGEEDTPVTRGSDALSGTMNENFGASSQAQKEQQLKSNSPGTAGGCWGLRVSERRGSRTLTVTSSGGLQGQGFSWSSIRLLLEASLLPQCWEVHGDLGLASTPWLAGAHTVHSTCPSP